MPCAIALATISTSAGESLSRSFHERAIWRAWTRSRSEIGGSLIGILQLHNRNVPESISLAAMRFDFRIRRFALRKRIVTMNLDRPGARMGRRRNCGVPGAQHDQPRQSGARLRDDPQGFTGAGGP